MGLSISLVINTDEVSAELQREATRHKKAGDWDKAIECLKKARDRADTGDLRLPVFLQQAGRFDEAMVEFERILSGVDARCARDYSHHPEFAQHGFTHHVRAQIYDKMRLACKRQKLPAEVAKYEALKEEFWEKHYDFQPVWEKYWKEDMARKRADLESRYPSLARNNVDSAAKAPDVFRSGRKIDSGAK